jgi:hypothetical protein
MRPQSRRRCCRPALEILEERQLLTATWLPQGPSPSAIIGGTLGIPGNQTAGAVTGIAIDPNNSSHVVIGTSDGGIWTTNDVMAAGGPVWTPRTDTMPFWGSATSSSAPWITPTRW